MGKKKSRYNFGQFGDYSDDFDDNEIVNDVWSDYRLREDRDHGYRDDTPSLDEAIADAKELLYGPDDFGGVDSDLSNFFDPSEAAVFDMIEGRDSKHKGKECPVCFDTLTPKPKDSWKCPTCGYREGDHYADKSGGKVINYPGGWDQWNKDKSKGSGKSKGGEIYKPTGSLINKPDVSYGGKAGKGGKPKYDYKQKGFDFDDWQKDYAASLKGGSYSGSSKEYKPIEKWTSAGGVVIHSLDEKGIDYVYLRKPSNNYGPWSFPKGKVEKGEAMEQVAVREVKEEIGLKAKILPNGYLGKGIGGFSITHYYLMVRTGGSTAQHDWESEAVKLFSIQEARELLQRLGSKAQRDLEILERAVEKIEALKKKLFSTPKPD